MKYGTKSKITFIDGDSGSFREKIEKYRNGELWSDYTRYEMRLKVSDFKEELAEYVKFRKEKGDKSMSFKIEYPREFDGSWYYIVKEFRD